MARTAVPLTVLSKEATVLQATGVALDPANGHVIAAPSRAGHILIDIDSTFAGAKVFTIRQGTHPGAQLGDTTHSLNAQRGLIQLTSARYFQLDGTVNIDVAAGATGTIRAYLLPY